MSLKHQPTITVCDIPGFVARHGNRRNNTMFFPNEGRLCAATQENMDLAAEGTLEVSIDALACLDGDAKAAAPQDHTYTQNVHPVTGTAAHYALFDRFHEQNSKSRPDLLRRLDFCSQLRGILNTQRVEELFSSVKKSLRSLTQLSPVNHIFLTRLLCLLLNQSKKRKLFASVSKLSSHMLPGTEAVANRRSRLRLRKTGRSNFISCIQIVSENLVSFVANPEAKDPGTDEVVPAHRGTPDVKE
jgi:hypothetical protein